MNINELALPDDVTSYDINIHDVYELGRWRHQLRQPDWNFQHNVA